MPPRDKAHNAANVRAWRKRTKQKLVDYKGGKCVRCGYDKCLAALEFHHTDPTKKDFGVSGSIVANFEKMQEEVEKCILVCSNCHREIHQEIFALQHSGNAIG